MGMKDTFTAAEWDNLSRAPFFVSLAIGMSDPSGPFGRLKESKALSNSVTDAEDGSHGELAKAVALEISRCRPSRSELVGDASDIYDVQRQAISEIGAIGRLSEKAGTDGAAFRRWLAAMAHSIADAATEGGFLGFGGERISAEEWSAIGQVRVALNL